MDVEVRPGSPSTSFSPLLLRAGNPSPLGGGCSRSGRWVPTRPAAICYQHPPTKTEVMMERRPAATFRAHREACTYECPVRNFEMLQILLKLFSVLVYRSTGNKLCSVLSCSVCSLWCHVWCVQYVLLCSVCSVWCHLQCVVIFSVLSCLEWLHITSWLLYL